MRQRTERRKTTEQKEKGKIIITKKKRGDGEQMKIKGIKTQVRWRNKCVEKRNGNLDFTKGKTFSRNN